MPINEQTFNVLNKLYQYDPTKFKEEEVDTLEQFAPKFNIDFRRNQDAGEFNLLNTVKQLGEGFVEGLTTLPVSKWLNDEPKNSAEKIAYSIGSLMGFVGWIPNPVGIMSKLGLSTFLKVAGYSAKAAELSKGISLGIHFKSPTMWAADKIMGTLNKTLKPALEATSFLKGSKGIIAKDMIEGGLHLGIASAINTAPFYDLSWQTAVDERANAFLHGGMFGAGNRFIGNLFSRNGLLDLTGTVTGESLPGILKLAETDKKAAFGLLTKGDNANKVARMLSSGIVFGMPSTIADQPLELQVYDYLLNAYFGGKEMGTHQKEALKFSEPYQKTGRQQLLINPTKLKGYEDLSPKAKQEMAIQSDILLGGWNHEAENNNAYVSIMSGLKESDDVQSMLAKFEESPDLTDAQKQKYEVVAIQQKTIEDGLREGKSEEEIMKEMPEKVSTALNNKYFYDIFKRVSEELTPEKFDNVGQEAINKFKDINGTFREYGLSTRWYNPIGKISDLVASKEGVKQGDVLTRLDTTNKVAKVAGELLKDRTIGKDTFIEEVKKSLEIELTPEVTREITRLHNELSQAVPRTFYAIKSGGRLEPLSQVTPQGLPRNITWFPRSELDTFYTGVGELKTWEGMHDARGKWVQDATGKFGPPQKYGEIPIYDAVNQGRITEAEIIVNAAKAGKLIISGRKDDANILFADIPKDMDEATISKTIDIIKDRRETIERASDTIDKGGKPVNIYAGTNENAVLSNFAKRPFIFNGGKFDSVEQFFQESKLAFTDPKYQDYNNNIHKQISTNTSGAVLKSLGRRYKGLDVKAWESANSNIMKMALKESFKQNPEALVKLLNTGNAKLTHIQDKGKWGKEFPRLLMEVRSELGGAKPRVVTSKGKITISPYEEGKARFVKDALKAEGVTEEITSKIYDMTTANAVKGLVEWNFGKDFGMKEALDIMEANPKAFVVNPMDIVKRMQIFNDRSPKLPEEEMIKRTGSDKFKFVILKTAKSGKKLLPWEDKATFAYNAINNNKLISVLHEAHMDGGVLIRSDVFNHMLESTGYPLGGTTIKGVHIFGGDSKLGGFIGKLAYHKASTELDTYMFENDIHGFHLDTTAKQRGLRKLMDWTVKNGKFELLDDAGATFIPKTTSTMSEGEKSIVEQDNVSYYRGQVGKPEIDSDGNLILRSKNDSLYKKAGLPSSGVSLTKDLKSAIDYAWGQNEVRKNLAADSYDAEKLLSEIDDKGTWIIKIPKEAVKNFVVEANEIKSVGDIIIPKGKYKLQEISGQEPETTQTLPEGIYDSKWNTLTVGNAEDMSHLNDKFTLAAQLQYNIEYDKPREAMVDYTKQYVVGTEAGQEAFKRFMLTKDYKELDKLDFEEDLGVSQKIEILKRNDNSKYWKKVIQEIFHTDPAEAEEILDNDTESYYQNWNEIQGSAKKIIDAGIEITPETLMLPDIRKYYETSVKNWLISKTVSPKVKYAWKGTFKVHDPMVASNIKIKPGEIWLDGGQKKQKVMYMGKEMTAENALKIHLADPKNTPKVELVGVRVPMDSASGARVLELKGFIGEEGGGFYVHPEEYANMGGADNDIDTAFLYWNLPKEVVEYYRSKKDQWYTKMAGGGKIFVEQKRTPWLLAEKDELYRYDVMSQLYGNKYSYEAKKNLGAFLSYGKRIKLFIQAQAKNGKITIQTKKGDKEYDINPETNVDFLVRELVNYSADAADGNRMKSVRDIRALLNYKIFGDAKINLFEDTTFKNMTTYDALRRGRSEEGQDYSAIGSIEALKGLPNYPHAIFEKMRMLADGVVPENLNKNIMPEQTSALLFKFKNMQGTVKDIIDKKIPKDKWTQKQKDSVEFTALAIKYAGKAKLGFSPEDYSWHVKQLMEKGYSENRAKAEVEEYKANDLLNLADIIDSIIKGKRLESTVLGLEAVKEIKATAFDLRERLRIVNEDLAKAPSKKVTTKVKETREALLNEARAYKDKLAQMDDLGYKRSYFESLLYSTAPGQSSDKILKMKEDLVKLESAEKKDEKAINKLKDQIDRFNSRFYTTEKRNIFGSSDLIQPQAIKDRVKTFTALIKEARLLDPIKENEYAKVSTNNPLANIIQEKTDIPMLMEPVKNVQEAERLNTLLKDTAKLKVTVADDISNRAKELFNKYPHLRRVFEDYYATWTLDTQGVAKELSTTTEPEITKFLSHMEAMMNVNPDGLALRKVDYFLAPSSIAKNFEGYEKGVSLKTIPVMNKRAEIINKVVAVPNGRFQKQYNILRIGAISKDKKLSTAELNFAEHPIAKGYASIPIEDRIFMNDYVWRMRESAYTDQEFYQDRFKEVQGEFDAKYKDKIYQIRIGGKTVPMTGEKFAKFMNEYYSERMDNTLRDVIINQKEFDEFRLKYVKDGVMMIDRWTTDMMKHAQTNNELPFFGLNVVEFIKAQHLLRNYKFGGTETKEGISAEQFSYNRDVREKDKAEYDFLMRYKNDPRYKKIFEDANAQRFTIPPKEFRDGYVPHMDFPQKLVNEQLAKLTEKYKDDPKKRKTLMLAMERYMSEGELSDLNSNEDFYKMFDGKDAMTNAKIENFMGSRSSNLLARNFEYPIGGYNTDYSAIAKYERSLYTQYYNSLTAILAHRNVDKFLYETNHSQNKIGAENAKYWAGFMRNKIRIALGAPSIFPKEMIEDKAYKIQGNPYYYLTDDYYARKSTMFDKFFGVDRKEMPQALIEKRVARKLATLSNLEAKWSMMSLLASPKAYLTNKLTAHLNTMVGAGFDYWKQAGSLEYLRKPEILGKHADSWESLKNWIDVNGGLESFIRAEAQLHPEFNTAKGKKLVEELISLHRQGKANSDSTIMELINRSGLADTITMKSAWFMRASEVDARLRAWTAHYLKAREIYDATNYSFDADDPWLIEQANKGVEATQFLYNIVERPDFASTSLGKIFARFQMFSMNSLLWRKKIAENYHKGVDKEKFERLMAADMAVMGLASLLPYTIVNAALPPPYNYLQQLTGWLFGDKTAREKAFFGAIPYPANIIQPLLPPSSRVVTSLFGLASGDFDSFLSYQVWTMFPFGRMVRDTYRAMDNPHLFMEREFGIPYNTLINRIAKTKD